ncbi:uncharacterized protein fam217bb [Engraulis encrasicolus]|uniref:uncharacterized protein fam217bb n=1 Tax=Engraulis encrasicolus TaxID=184585 RepID=UPI002FD5FC6A
MMGTILEERAPRNNPHNLYTKGKRTSKSLWSSGAPTKQSTMVYKSGVPNGLHRESRIPLPEGYPPKMRGKLEEPSLMDTPSAQVSQTKPMTPKPRPQVSFLRETRTRPWKAASHSKNETGGDVSHSGPQDHVSHTVNIQSGLRRDCSLERREGRRRYPSSDRAKQQQQQQRQREISFSDSASDLSDTERGPELPAAPSTPPKLDLRAEVIDPAEFQRRPRASSSSSFRRQCQPSRSYPDFLPPPFNGWSLQQLAVFLNTEGKGIPRPKPSDHLERYLERLLKLEWHQIQTVRNETGVVDGAADGDGACCSTSNIIRGRHTRCRLPRPHSSPSAKLSTPKSILQCQRAFPLALLSSITTPSLPVQQVGCACPHCHVRYPHCNGSCHSAVSSYGYQQSSRLSPVMERRRRPSGMPKRSSSESRAYGHPHTHTHTHAHGYALGSVSTFPSHSYHDPGKRNGNGSSHLRRMQAAGNIRNPSLSPPRLRAPVSGALGPAEAAVSGGRDRASGGGGNGGGGGGGARDTRGREGREVSQRRRSVSERRRSTPSAAKQDLKTNGHVDTDHFVGRSRDRASGRATGRTKHVEFVT